MIDLVSKDFPKSRSAYLAGMSRSMIYYQRRKREPQYDADREKRISDIVTEGPSYGTRRVKAMIRRSGSRSHPLTSSMQGVSSASYSP